jgi:ankyrin repeat protein
MIMQPKVNDNIKITLTDTQKKEAYEEIKRACTRKYLTLGQNSDLKKIKDVFKKYFDPENPLLDINDPLEKGSDFNPLITVVWLGLAEETSELLKLNANPGFFLPNSAINAILIAATNGRTLICHKLLKKSPSIAKLKNAKGQTPLMVAAEGGHLDIVKLLLEGYKVNVTEKDNDNRTALDYANKNKHHQVEAFLRYFELEKSLHNKKEEKKINKI